MDIKLCGYILVNWSDLKCSINYIIVCKFMYLFICKRNWKIVVKKKIIIINFIRVYYESIKIYYFVIFRFLYLYIVKNIFNICNLFIFLLFEK